MTEDENQRGCFLTLLSFALLALFIYSLFDNFSYCGLSAENNPKTTGIITQSQVNPSSFGKTNQIVINYEYVVDNERYTSNRVTCNSSGANESVVDQYPVGAQVQVYYKKTNPALAILEPAFGRNLMWVYIAGVGFLFTFILIWVDNAMFRWLAPAFFGVFLLSFNVFLFLYPPTNDDSAASIRWVTVVMHLLVLLSGLSLLLFSNSVRRQRGKQSEDSTT